MNDTNVGVESAELDGGVLLEQGRTAREKRRQERTLRARVTRLLEGKPAWMRYTAVSAAAVVTLLLALVTIDVAASYGRVHPGVRVGEVGIGARTPERAAELVEGVFAPRVAEPVTLVYEEHSWDVRSDHLGVTLDTAAIVEEAMAIGRTGSLTERVRTRIGLWLAPQTLPVRVTAESTAVAGVLSSVAETIERQPADASVVIEGVEARLEPAVLGVSLRHDALRDHVLAAFAATDRDVEIPVEFTPVKVTDEDAREALQDAGAMLAGPVTVTHASEEWEIPAADVAGWIDFRTVPARVSRPGTASPAATGTASDAIALAGADDMTSPSASDRFVLEAFISAEKARDGIIARTGSASRAPKDARFKVGGGSVTIIPSEDGVGPDVDALAVEMTRVLTTGSNRTVELKTRRIEPELSTEKAQAMGIRERIATYTTTYAASNRPRVNNIHTLAAALDGTLMAPGEVFSFNETIGPRTAARGYQEAPAIIDGRLVPSLGGGICQVATTIFNTVFESGLPVVERRNHSFYISTYPDGRDAAVAWGGPDFKFKNDTPHWVLIATAYTNSSVTVSLYGTDPGYQVKAQPGPFTDIVPFATKQTEDPSLPVGTQVVEDSGANGRRIVVKRTVTRGGAVVREDSFVSVYRPKQQVVRVGTRVEESTVTTGTVSP